MPTTIFLCYGRDDDEPFVTRLHADFAARGFDVWRDNRMTKSEGRMAKEAKECERRHRTSRRSFLTSDFGFPSSFGNRHSRFATLQRTVTKVFADPGYFENVAQGRAKLGDLLASKAVLLVLDNDMAPTRSPGKRPTASSRFANAPPLSGRHEDLDLDFQMR